MGGSLCIVQGTQIEALRASSGPVIQEKRPHGDIRAGGFENILKQQHMSDLICSDLVTLSLRN